MHTIHLAILLNCLIFDRIRFRCHPFPLCIFSVFFVSSTFELCVHFNSFSYFSPAFVMRYCLFVERYFSAIALRTLTITWYSLERNLWHFSCALQYSSWFGWHTETQPYEQKLAKTLLLPACNPSNEKENSQNKFIHIMDLLGIISFHHCFCSVSFPPYFFGWIELVFLRVEW